MKKIRHFLLEFCSEQICHVFCSETHYVRTVKQEDIPQSALSFTIRYKYYILLSDKYFQLTLSVPIVLGFLGVDDSEG